MLVTEREREVAETMAKVYAAGGDLRLSPDHKKVGLVGTEDPEIHKLVRRNKAGIVEALASDPLDTMGWNVRSEFFRKMLRAVDKFASRREGENQEIADKVLTHGPFVDAVNERWLHGTFVEYRDELTKLYGLAIRAVKDGKFDPPKTRGFKA